jgi:hypothetical protein
MTPQYTEFLRRCIELGAAPNIALDVCSNITNINSDLLDQMLQFKRCRIQCSLDGIGDAYEYIRVPANWEKVRGNLIRLMELTKTHNLHVGINMVVQLFNMLELSDIIEEFVSLYEDHCAVHWTSKFNIRLTCIHWPYQFRLSKAPELLRRVALHRFRDWRSTTSISDEVMKHVIEPGSLDMIEHELSTQEEAARYTGAEILEYCRFIDQNKKQKLESKIPNLYGLLQKV